MNKSDLNARIDAAAEATLRQHGVLSPLEFLQAMRFLDGRALDQWKKGNLATHQALEPMIQCGEAKLAHCFREFEAWASRNQLEPIELPFHAASREGKIALQVTVDGNPEREAWYRRGYRRANLTPAQQKRLDAKLNKVPELVVFQAVRDDVVCTECQAEHALEDMYFLEREKVICLECADLDHLEFLPRGDVAMTRRAKKHSPLHAVVLCFNRRRKTFERQGLLVTSQAIQLASEECEADADKRAVHREKGAMRRTREDALLVQSFTDSIIDLFPGCPPTEASDIAHHAAQRHSGRVGRSAAGRAVDAKAVTLAVRAWIRHQHTDYDERLMRGEDRMESRAQIHDTLEAVCRRWQNARRS